MAGELVERLRDYGLTLDESVVICDRRVVDEAADRIEALERENATLRAALEPFASISDLVDAETEGLDNSDTFDLMFHDYLLDRLPLEDFRRAAAIRNMGGEG